MEVQQSSNDEIENAVEVETFDTVVNCQVKLNPISEESLKSALTDDSLTPSEVTMPSLTKLFAEPTTEILDEVQPVVLRAKDSTMINIKKQQHKSSNQSVRHLMQINFKLPPKQEAMILEMSSVMPLKEMRNLEEENNNTNNNNIENDGVDLVKGFSCTSQTKSITSNSNESKSVRFQEKTSSHKLHSGETERPCPQFRPPITPLPNSTIKQRALELHSYRIAVEQKRLELLDVKIDREREALKREQIKLVEAHDAQFKDFADNEYFLM